MAPVLALLELSILPALGLSIVVGCAGIPDLGHIAFYAIGAYAGVVAASLLLRSMHRLASVVYFLMIPVVAALAALAGIGLDTPTLRLRGD